MLFIDFDLENVWSWYRFQTRIEKFKFLYVHGLSCKSKIEWEQNLAFVFQ